MTPLPISSAAQTLAHAMARLPLIAILRGLTSDEAPSIGEALVNSGFAIIEVPLNSPDPLQSIAKLTRQFPHTLIGAGTVLNAQQVKDVHAAGGRLVVAPNFNPAVVAQALTLNRAVLPPQTSLMPVGGITPDNMASYKAAGASGFGLGSALYSPGRSAEGVRERALAFVNAYTTA